MASADQPVVQNPPAGEPAGPVNPPAGQQLESKTPLFLTPINARECVILMDLSGSMGNRFGDEGLRTFDRALQVIANFPHEMFRFIGWNSTGGPQKTGSFVLPGSYTKDKLPTAFMLMAPHIGNSTKPSKGFSAIPREWIKDDVMFYLVTDGEIDFDEHNTLSLVIRDFTGRLSIIAVTPAQIDFSDVEEVQVSAGGDVYRIIQQQHLTSRIERFETFGVGGSCVQINQVRASKGFVPYGEFCFSELRMNEFVRYIREELAAHGSEEDQMKIAQKLSASLEYLTKDKPQSIVNDIIRTFAQMFTISPEIVHWILADAINANRAGQAAILAGFRSQLKDLFKRTDESLKRDVRSAVGMAARFITPIINGRIMVGGSRLVTSPVYSNGTKYPNGGYKNYIPAYPLIESKEDQIDQMADQALRQWVRAVSAPILAVHPSADEIIFDSLVCMLIVCKSDVSVTYKNGYRAIARCMLRKKRLNSQQTESERLYEGNLPIPNSGKLDEMYTLLNNVAHRRGVVSSPLRLWFEICKVLDPALAAVQEKHCKDVLDEECIVPKIVIDVLPEGSDLDYTDPITFDDTSSVGGYRINPHNGEAGRCTPLYVLSENSYQLLLQSQICQCPLCYMRLTAVNFARVPPMVAPMSEETLAQYKEYERQFADSYRGVQSGGQAAGDSRQAKGGHWMSKAERQALARKIKSGGQPAQPDQKQDGGQAAGGQNGIRNANGIAGKIVILKGTVGAGKSTLATQIRAYVEANGGVCIVEGTDKYCKTGASTQDAIGRVTASLRSISTITNNKIVVVIDTCGERSNPRDPNAFGVDFTGWDRIELYPNMHERAPNPNNQAQMANFRGYLAWSLRNVLQRRRPTAQDNHYLNPEGAGVGTCLRVHKQKCDALFGANLMRAAYDQAVGDGSIATLSRLADAYAANLPKTDLSILKM